MKSLLLEWDHSDHTPPQSTWEEAGLPVEVRGSNGAFYKVRRRAGQGRGLQPPPSSQNGEEWGGIEVLELALTLRTLDPRSHPRPSLGETSGS